MVKWQKYASNSTIQPTAEVTWPFGTDKSVPYEHTGRGAIHPTFVNQVKDNIAAFSPQPNPCIFWVCMIEWLNENYA